MSKEMDKNKWVQLFNAVINVPGVEATAEYLYLTEDTVAVDYCGHRVWIFFTDDDPAVCAYAIENAVLAVEKYGPNGSENKKEV